MSPTRRKPTRRSVHKAPHERAFRDAMRDILAAEGWFELDVEPAVERPSWRWPLDQLAIA